MARIFAIALGLSAVLFMAYAVPHPYEEGETTEAPAATTTGNPIQAGLTQPAGYTQPSGQPGTEMPSNNYTMPGAPPSQAPPGGAPNNTYTMPPMGR